MAAEERLENGEPLIEQVSVQVTIAKQLTLTNIEGLETVQQRCCWSHIPGSCKFEISPTVVHTVCYHLQPRSGRPTLNSISNCAQAMYASWIESCWNGYAFRRQMNARAPLRNNEAA